MDGILRDIRHSIRGLRRSPGFALAVLLTLALGIGGNTAIFSVVDQVLLRPLPYPDGDRIVRLYESRADRPTGATPRSSNGVSPANWLDWQQQSRTISSMGVWFDVARTLTGLGEPERLNGQYVSWEFATKANKWQGRNSTRWTNPEYDKAYKAAEAEMDAVKRAALFIRMNDMIIQDRAIIPVVARPRVRASNLKLKTNESGWDSDFWALQDWYREA